MKDMCKIKQVGRYSVDFAGHVYSNNEEFQMVIVTETDKLKHESLKKLFYFKSGKDYVVPPLNTEEETAEFFKHPSGTKFQSAKRIMYSVI